VEIIKEPGQHGVFLFKVTIPKEDVKHAREHVVGELSKGAKLAGFRPGHAPRELVEEHLDDSKVYGEVINHLIPDVFAHIQAEHPLEVITGPKVKLLKFEPGSDLTLAVTLITKPQVVLGNWQEKLSGITKKEAALDKLVETTTIDLPEQLVEEERDRMLSRLIQQLTQLGLELTAYVASQNKTVEQLKEEYAKQAVKSLKLHYLLDKLVEDCKIEVSEEEIQAAISAAPDEKSREALAEEEQKWYIKLVLARNKVLDLIYSQIPKEKEGVSKEEVRS